MAIVDDYAAIGQAYHKLTDGWLPREEKTDKEKLNRICGELDSQADVRSIVEPIKGSRRTFREGLDTY